MARYLFSSSTARTVTQHHGDLLGTWCLLQSELLEFSPSLIPYHWSDRNNYNSAQDYLEETYESFLSLVASCLNQHHSCNYSLTFWRILVGPWLRSLLDIIYDRWQVLLTAQKTNPNYILVSSTPCTYPPKFLDSLPITLPYLAIPLMTISFHIYGII